MNKLILIIEDDVTLSRSLREILEHEGFSTRAVVDGESALAVMHNDHPALVLLDLTLPGMSGLEILKTIRADESIKDTPVIVLSNRDEIDVVSETLKDDVRDYLVKHEWRIEDVVARVKERLGRE